MQDENTLREVAKDCVHCGFCLPACPTYQLWAEEMDSPRGRIYLVNQILDGAELSSAAAEHFDRCLGCMACMTACPSGVQYDQLIEAARVWTEEARSGSDGVAHGSAARNVSAPADDNVAEVRGADAGVTGDAEVQETPMAGRPVPPVPQAPGQQPSQCGEEGAVNPVRPPAGDVPTQHCDLVPQHEDLRILRGVTPGQERQPAEHPDHEQVDETDQHEPRA